jgi:hypothetical protein
MWAKVLTTFRRSHYLRATQHQPRKLAETGFCQLWFQYRHQRTIYINSQRRTWCNKLLQSWNHMNTFFIRFLKRLMTSNMAFENNKILCWKNIKTEIKIIAKLNKNRLAIWSIFPGKLENLKCPKFLIKCPKFSPKKSDQLKYE